MVQVTRRYHVAAFSGRSGIARYAEEFYQNVLAQRGYERLDSDQPLGGLGDDIDLTAEYHLEVGVNEGATIALLERLLLGGAVQVDLTMHDPPFVAWPHVRFPNRVLNQASKFVHLYLRNFGIVREAILKVRRVYALSEAGCRAIRARHRIDNVCYLPFVVPADRVRDPQPAPPNLIFFGFPAPNKGLHYALELHRQLLSLLPATRFHVAGSATKEPEQQYLDDLRRRFTRNVEYHGYVRSEDLDLVFDDALVALQPFTQYRSVVPASSSILDCMKRGKAVAATAVNAVPELIEHGRTGFLLCGQPQKDVALLAELLASPAIALDVATRAATMVRQRHNADVVGAAFDASQRA